MKEKKKKLAFVALLFLAALFANVSSALISPPKTAPKSALDFVFWPALKVTWEPFSLKRSHFWHWKTYDGPVGKMLPMKGDKNAQPITSMWSQLVAVNFRWKTVAVLSLFECYTCRYQVGFIFGKTRQLCSLVIDGRSAVLIGPNDVDFFAITYPEGRPISLCNDAITTKQKLSSDITLL